MHHGWLVWLEGQFDSLGSAISGGVIGGAGDALKEKFEEWTGHDDVQAGHGLSDLAVPAKAGVAEGDDLVNPLAGQFVRKRSCDRFDRGRRPFIVRLRPVQPDTRQFPEHADHGRQDTDGPDAGLSGAQVLVHMESRDRCASCGRCHRQQDNETADCPAGTAAHGCPAPSIVRFQVADTIFHAPSSFRKETSKS